VLENYADLLTRGFDTSQAKQLAALASSYALKTGKPLKDVTRQIADAANGSAEAIKELGIQVAKTGTRTGDAEAAIRALMGSYGEVGAELANPFDRLKGNVDAVFLALGEQLLPVFGPLVEQVNLFVSGLLNSEKGKGALLSLGQGLKDFTDMMMWAGDKALAVSDLVRHGFGAVRDFILMTVTALVSEVVKVIASLLEKIPGGGAWAKQLREFAKGSQDFADASGFAAAQAVDELGVGVGSA